jgi:hypothetical protein
MASHTRRLENLANEGNYASCYVVQSLELALSVWKIWAQSLHKYVGGGGVRKKSSIQISFETNPDKVENK